MVEAPKIKPTATRTIGIDYGMARLGIAISDETKTIATPWLTLQAAKKMEQTIEKLLQELAKHQETWRYTIHEIVIGLPLMMSGKYGVLADEVKHFVELLRQHVTCPVIMWDERLTTVQAERSLRESSLTRKRRAKAVDSVAAVIILQSYLDLKKIQQN